MSAQRESDELVLALIAALRGHGHLCNVLTHVGLGNWRAIEQAIVSILRPGTRARELNAIARNIVELLVDGRGVTGPIMRDVFFAAMVAEAGPDRSRRLKRKIAHLGERMRQPARRPADAPSADRRGARRSAAPQRTEPRAQDSAPVGKAA